LSVRVNYSGRVGNNLFQYFAGRFFAQENGMRLNTRWVSHPIVPILEDCDEEARDGGGQFIRIGDEHKLLNGRWGKANYEMAGNFQVGRWYYERRRKIIDLVALQPVVPRDPDDLVVNIRLGDYVWYHAAIHASWYHRIIEKEKFKRIVLVTDEPEHPYLRSFDRYRPTLVSGTPAEHLRVLRNAKKLIMSNSTFCWWAAFLGEAEKLYIFSRWIDNAGSQLGDFPGAIRVDGAFLHEKS
jgi:Glycosyl transferase family 11